MILKPRLDDYKIIGYYLGKITISIGVVMMIPFIIAIAYSEWPSAIDFLLSTSITLILGAILSIICYTKKDLATMHAMSVAALSWIVAMLVSAIPLFLSAHYGSYLDACFEALSGYATTGLTLVVDLDHMSNSCNFWRHLIMFIGGQGIVVIALTFLVRGTSGALRMYVGEARDEKIMPNVVETARFIWLVSIVYLVLGSGALSIAAIWGGLPPLKAVFDSVCIFIAAWDTGGFTPQSQNILFYHNLPLEIITISLMLLGATNFALHYTVWTGNRRELYKNIEIITLFVSVIVVLSITAWGVIERNIYNGVMPFSIKTFYHLISAHTGTGYSTIYPRQFINGWGPLAMLGVTLAMAIGGSVCSTTGGIKVFRIGVIYKALRQDIKKMLLPDSAVFIQKIHHIKDVVLKDKYVRVSALIFIAYVCLYALGTVVGMLYGYSLSEALFESVSAAANVGLSCGITSPAMPIPLKLVYMFQMWAGRLEFIAVMVLLGTIIAAFRGKK